MKELTPFFVLLINLHFPLVHSHSNNDFPVDTCLIENRSCEIHKENLIESFTVNTENECRQQCGYLENCQYLSYFGANNFPVVNYCMLFSNCSILEYCGEDCYTEDKKFCDSCGRNFESRLGDNVIEWIPDVEEEGNCRGLCLEDAGCLYFTYYKKESEHLPNLCILLSDLDSSFQECEHCITSIPDCGNTSYISCKFTIDSNQSLHDSHVFTNVDDSVNVIFSPLASLACEATVIAIGGGGKSGGSNGGGGSGYVKSDVIDVSSTEYQASVGQYGQDSIFKIKNGQNIITAQAGGDGTGNQNGGDGYSGGGGYEGNHGGCNGGSDGSNGDSNYGGSGSGLDISTISLKYHMLNPGNGGKPNGNYGGGGGGVLVDNVGPSSNTYQGEGYGGGGYHYGNGLQGMILIETKSKT